MVSSWLRARHGCCARSARECAVLEVAVLDVVMVLEAVEGVNVLVPVERGSSLFALQLATTTDATSKAAATLPPGCVMGWTVAWGAGTGPWL